MDCSIFRKHELIKGVINFTIICFGSTILICSRYEPLCQNELVLKITEYSLGLMVSLGTWLEATVVYLLASTREQKSF